MIDCSACKRPSIDCPGAEWYSPRDIKFCRQQVIWIIRNLPLMREGIWPRHPEGELASPIVQKPSKHQAYFETPAQIAGEVDYRLNRTGLEGKLLVSEINLGLDYLELQPEARRALNYVVGWRRKRLAYPEWKRQRKYRGKEVAKC
jgi:hypothetical protein